MLHSSSTASAINHIGTNNNSSAHQIAKSVREFCYKEILSVQQPVVPGPDNVIPDLESRQFLIPDKTYLHALTLFFLQEPENFNRSW